MSERNGSANKMSDAERIASWKRSQQRREMPSTLYDELVEEELEEYVIHYGQNSDGEMVYKVELAPETPQKPEKTESESDD